MRFDLDPRQSLRAQQRPQAAREVWHHAPGVDVSAFGLAGGAAVGRKAAYRRRLDGLQAERDEAGAGTGVRVRRPSGPA